MTGKTVLLLSVVFLSNLPLAAGAAGAASGSAATDYSISAHWLSVPTAVNKRVDVFYLYPTAWQKVKATDPNICAIDNPSMLKGSKGAFGRQATAFEKEANIYAPYYRQADAEYTLSLPPAGRDKVMRGIPMHDAVAAFEYYIKHYNKGRPFLLVGHSQGANLLLYLLSDYLGTHRDVYKRMIAAYVIGYTVTQAYLDQNRHLKFATGPDDTGVIVSYNTQSPNVAKGANPVVLDGALAINPITWTRGQTLATTAQGLGSFMPDTAGVFSRVPQYADARIDTTKGVVVCSTADESTMKLGFGPGIFHSYDFPFYYYNLRANAAERIAKFLGKRSK